MLRSVFAIDWLSRCTASPHRPSIWLTESSRATFSCRFPRVGGGTGMCERTCVDSIRTASIDCLWAASGRMDPTPSCRNSAATQPDSCTWGQGQRQPFRGPAPRACRNRVDRCFSFISFGKLRRSLASHTLSGADLTGFPRPECRSARNYGITCAEFSGSSFTMAQLRLIQIDCLVRRQV